jgi:hypothetical protein
VADLSPEAQSVLSALRAARAQVEEMHSGDTAFVMTASLLRSAERLLHDGKAGEADAVLQATLTAVRAAWR